MEIEPSTLSTRLIALENLIDKAKESLHDLREKLSGSIVEAFSLLEPFTALMKNIEEEYISLCRVAIEKAQDLDIESPQFDEGNFTLALLKDIIS